MTVVESNTLVVAKAYQVRQWLKQISLRTADAVPPTEVAVWGLDVEVRPEPAEIDYRMGPQPPDAVEIIAAFESYGGHALAEMLLELYLTIDGSTIAVRLNQAVYDRLGSYERQVALNMLPHFIGTLVGPPHS